MGPLPVKAWPSGIARQNGTGGRQAHAARVTEQERDTQFLLQLLDLHRQRRLGDEQALRCAGHAAQLGNCDEVPEMTELQAVNRIRQKYGMYTKTILIVDSI